MKWPPLEVREHGGHWMACDDGDVRVWDSVVRELLNSSSPAVYAYVQALLDGHVISNARGELRVAR